MYPGGWNNLLSHLTTVVLSQEEDEFIWTLDRKGEFSVKSHYLGLIHQNIPNTNKHLWELKTPLKIKVFLWYLRKGVILTKDNLARRKWQGNQQCCFCHENETIQHLFFDCRFARLGWATAYAAWGLPRTHSVDDMFGHWLDGIQSNLKPLILLGASALCWSLWLCRNAFIFGNKHTSFFAGHISYYALAMYLGCTTKVFFPGSRCSGFSVFGAGGQGVFYPGTWSSD